MYPIIFRIGDLNIYAYGLFLFISFLIGTKIVEYRAQRFGVHPDKITNLALIVLIAVILGARLFYVIFHWSEFASDLIGIIAFWRGGLGGLMFYGGFLFGLLAGILYARKAKMPLLKMLDAITPAIMLGEFFTRLGCFLNGCCFGKPTNSLLGITFPKHSAAGYTFECPVHPTQLYSSFAGLILFVFALILEKRQLKSGVLFGIILLFYSLFRFGIDFVRYYENATNFWANQIIALGLSIFAIAFIIIRIKGKQ